MSLFYRQMGKMEPKGSLWGCANSGNRGKGGTEQVAGTSGVRRGGRRRHPGLAIRAEGSAGSVGCRGSSRGQGRSQAPLGTLLLPTGHRQLPETPAGMLPLGSGGRGKPASSLGVGDLLEVRTPVHPGLNPSTHPEGRWGEKMDQARVLRSKCGRCPSRQARLGHRGDNPASETRHWEGFEAMLLHGSARGSCGHCPVGGAWPPSMDSRMPGWAWRTEGR